MRRFASPTLVLASLALAGCGRAEAPAPAPGPAPLAPDQPGGPTLQPFGSEAELAAFGAALGEEIRRMEARRRERMPESVPMPPPPPAAADAAGSITSVQVQGVDEGGIVKVHGDHLVVLRRGRLFTIRVGDDSLRPVAAVDAFAPGIDPARSWYDEMLVSGDHVVVIGYSYARGGTELGVFRIGADGSLAHRATYHLRAADYYSARNYASRLIGDRLVFYSPIRVRADLSRSLPAIRRWGDDGGWVPTASARRIYRPANDLRVERGVFLHTVTSCDLAAAELRCESTAFFGPRSSEFHVSRGSVYLWTTESVRRPGEGPRPPSMVYRMPLDGTAPTALRTSGDPIDQFSFHESADGHLNVLTRLDAHTLIDLWREEAAPNAVALLRVPLSALTDGSRTAPREAYRILPTPEAGPLQNRYVGDWLLYGRGAGWGRARPGETPLYAVRWAEAGDAAEVALPHGVDRIEALGADALVVGGDGNSLLLSTLRLDGDAPRLADRFTRPGASQGETRSHGFYYRADGDGAGVLGIPLRGADRPGWEHLRRGSVSMLFLRNDGLRLEDGGELPARPEGGDDGCRASCVDWYGNARPIFLRGRILALMGYELVEGAMDDGRIREVRRVSFAPAEREAP